MEITINFLKQIALETYNKVKPLIGTKKGGKRLEQGAGGDISMQIDLIAENIIIEMLKKAKVDLLLISEEVGEIYIGDKKKAINNNQKLIVDPIDGSTNSVRGIPFCCVSIAYAIGDTLDNIEKAVIIDLTTKDIYWAEKGKGAFLNDKKIYVSENNISDRCLFEIDFDLWNASEGFAKYRPIIKKLYRIRVMGSNALTFCMLAKGAIDGFIDLRKSNRLMDIAASYLIIKEAGGKMFSKNGEDLEIKLSLDAKIPLVASNAKLESFLRKELKKINILS
ncbi:MAG: inositol monophosphatase family protein [Promethearchaeota archaeon]